MAKRFAVSDATQTTNTTTSKTLAVVGTVTGTLIRPAIYDVIFGASGTPADNAMRYELQRFTAAGTTTAKTPNALDPGDVASLATCGVDATVEPTKTAAAILLQIAANQRATFRWVAAPDGELKGPATTANGLAVCSLSPAYTGATFATVHFWEAYDASVNQEAVGCDATAARAESGRSELASHRHADQWQPGSSL